MKEELVKELALIVGEDWITLEEERILGYLYDQTPDPMKPEPSKDVVVVKPKNAKEVSKILLIANKYRVPVFPRGGGTGLAAACMPTMSGIILSLERMNKISIDKDKRICAIQKGIGGYFTLQQVRDIAKIASEKSEELRKMVLSECR